MKSKIDLETNGLLLDLNTCLKKKQYRSIINKIEMRIAKNSWTLDAHRLVPIFFIQNKAIHYLMDYIVIGRMQKKDEILQKMFRIVTRNLRICYRCFADRMGQFMICFGSVNQKLNQRVPVLSAAEISANIATFLSQIMKTCFYYNIFDVFEGINCPNISDVIKNCEQIHRSFARYKKKDLGDKIVEIQMGLVLMAQSMQEMNFSRTKKFYYQSVLSILASYASVNRKQRSLEKKLSAEKMEILKLLLVSIINNQRMLIQSDNLVGWETGYKTLKSIIGNKFYQTSWMRYFRIETQNSISLNAKRFCQVSEIFVPFLIDDFDYLKNVIDEKKRQGKNMNFKEVQELKNNQNLTHPPQRHEQKRLSFKSKLEDKFYQEKFKRSLRRATQTKRQNESTNFLISGRTQRYSRSVPLRSTQLSQRPQSNIRMSSLHNSTKALPKSERCGKKQNVLHNLLSSFSGVSTLASTSDSCCVACSANKQDVPILIDRKIKASAEVMKSRRKQLKFYKVVFDYEENKKIKPEDTNIYSGTKMLQNSNKGIMDDTSSEAKSNEMSVIEGFKKLLAKNKKNLRITLLIEKYDQAKKRKKMRNYETQIMDIELEKNINIFIVNQTQPKQRNFPLKQSFQKRARSNEIFHVQDKKENPLKVSENSSKSSEKKPSDSLALQLSHNKSKEVINEMLKKITNVSEFKAKNKRKQTNKNGHITKLSADHFRFDSFL